MELFLLQRTFLCPLNLGAFAYAGGSNPPTSYLANAANIALGNTSVFSGTGTGTGTEEDNNSTTRLQMQLKKNDGPTSQADTMVKNMNQMFGLPNSIDEEHEMALPDGTISKASTKRSKRKESLDQIVEVDHEGEIDEESPFGNGSIDMEAATAVGAEIKAVVAGGVIDLSNRLQSKTVEIETPVMPVIAQWVLQKWLRTRNMTCCVFSVVVRVQIN